MRVTALVAVGADAGIPFEVDIVTEIVQDPRGAVGGAICDVAQEQEAAAVIIAGYGKGMLESMLLGSITNFVTHHCSRPTVIFHPSAQPTVVRPVSQDKEP